MKADVKMPCYPSCKRGAHDRRCGREYPVVFVPAVRLPKP